MQHKIIANLEKSILLKYLSLDEINISLPHSKIYFSLDQEKVYYKRSKRKLAKCLSNLNKHYGYNFASG
ncbi:MAG: hypothetical protein KKA19_01815, partial [Candidatus Margulisbacteria bacterium]|nr:hypothetical protein [Candidatus Margulisiibacteriota bacterium]